MDVWEWWIWRIQNRQNRSWSHLTCHSRIMLERLRKTIQYPKWVCHQRSCRDSISASFEYESGSGSRYVLPTHPYARYPKLPWSYTMWPPWSPYFIIILTEKNSTNEKRQRAKWRKKILPNGTFLLLQFLYRWFFFVFFINRAWSIRTLCRLKLV
jgi:hypothetical protein